MYMSNIFIPKSFDKIIGNIIDNKFAKLQFYLAFIIYFLVLSGVIE